MKRRGETFTEFLVATAVFGIMMGGLFEFMANQSETLADIKNRDELMYYANWCMAAEPEKARGNSPFTHEDKKAKFTPDGGTNLTVTLMIDDENLTDDKKERGSMTFKLKP